MTYLNHLNPVTITVFDKTEKTKEIPFDILKWITPALIVEFGEELILEAIGSLGLVFQDLTTYQTITDNGYWMDSFLNGKRTHHILFDSQEHKYVKGGRHGVDRWIDYKEYHLAIPSNLKDGEIIRFCLLHKFPYLTYYKVKSTEKIQMLPIQTQFVTLKDIPEELRNKTVNELLEIKEPFVIEKYDSAITCYTMHSETFDNYEFYLKTSAGTLYIPYQAVKHSDFTAIETRMTDYFGSQYKGQQDKLKEVQAILNSPEAKKLQKHMKHELVINN